MRIIVRKDKHTGATEIIVRGGLPYEGEFVHTYQSNVVPVIEFESEPHVEVFIPSDVDIHSAKDWGQISPHHGLSVWRGKIPDAGR